MRRSSCNCTGSVGQRLHSPGESRGERQVENHEVLVRDAERATYPEAGSLGSVGIARCFARIAGFFSGFTLIFLISG